MPWGMCEPCTADALLEAVRVLQVSEPDLGFKPLLAKLREQQPDLGAGTKEVRVALTALKAESEAKATAAAAAAAAATAAPALAAAADKGGPPAPAALSLACFGCARLPSDMDDDREKHPVCPKCVKLKVPTTYWCCVNCPGNPGAWKQHAAYHKEVKRMWKTTADGGQRQQRARELAEEQTQHAAQSGDEYSELMAEGARYDAKEDYRRAARAFREAIALRPDEYAAYFNLGTVLNVSGLDAEAAQRYLEAKERMAVGSYLWARAAAAAFDLLRLEVCDKVAKPEWWNDEGLKALSARVVRAAPDDERVHCMRASVLSGSTVLSGSGGTWGAGPRSKAELKEAAVHYDRCSALSSAPAQKAEKAQIAEMCRRKAHSM